MEALQECQELKILSHVLAELVLRRPGQAEPKLPVAPGVLMNANARMRGRTIWPFSHRTP